MEQRLKGLNKLDEFLLEAYENSALYKEKMKMYHDQKSEKRDIFGWGLGAFVQF